MDFSSQKTGGGQKLSVDGLMRFAAYRGFLGVLELAVGITSGKFADFDPNGCSDVVVQLNI
jgi:hypothetical protein